MKAVFNLLLVREIAAELRRAHPPFDVTAFVARAADGLDQFELTARAAHIADALYEFLPQPFPRAAAVIEASLGPEIPATGEMGLTTLRYLPYVTFVQKFGLDDYEAAIRVQAELTKCFTAEFSIRVFLERYPARAYAQMVAWAQDDNAHLRRLASEGLRPRLPLRHAGDGGRMHQRAGRGRSAMRCAAWSRPVTVKRFAFLAAKRVHACALRTPPSHSEKWPWAKPFDSRLKWKAWRVVRNSC